MKPLTPFHNAQAMALMHPSSFEAPSRHDLSRIVRGDFVKICCGDERFWAIVDRIDGSTITATVNNTLLFTEVHGLQAGDHVTFDVDHVYDIITATGIG